MEDQQNNKTKEEDGALLLGGFISKLHREMPRKARWSSCEDGYLWKSFTDLVQRKGPTTVKLTKAKAQAIKEDGK